MTKTRNPVPEFIRFSRVSLFLLIASCFLYPSCAVGQSTFASVVTSLPEEPHPATSQGAAPDNTKLLANDMVSLLGTPKRILHDELGVVTSPAHIHTHDLVWLLPLAGATAASFATDTRTMRDVVSSDAGFNSDAATSSEALRGILIGGPVLLFATGHFMKNDHAREAGLLAGEAMIDGYITSEGIKYITLRERPYLDHARGKFYASDAVSDPSFVSGHSIVAWSSAAVLASEYSRPWQQIGIYTLATGASLTRVLSQQHFPTDALLGSAAGWLIGRYVYRSHHRASR